MWKQRDLLDDQGSNVGKIFGRLNYGDHNEHDKKWINSVCVLTAEPTGFPEGLEMGLGENRRMKDNSMVLVFVLLFSFFF